MYSIEELYEILQDHRISEGKEPAAITKVMPLVKAPNWPDADKACCLITHPLMYLQVDFDDEPDDE